MEVVEVKKSHLSEELNGGGVFAIAAPHRHLAVILKTIPLYCHVPGLQNRVDIFLR